MVSDPANAIDTAMVLTRESVINSGLSCFACTNFESKSGFEPSVVDVGKGGVEESLSFGYRSDMRSWAKRATGEVTSMRPHLERRR